MQKHELEDRDVRSHLQEVTEIAILGTLEDSFRAFGERVGSSLLTWQAILFSE